MIKETLEKVISGADLTVDESYKIMNHIMMGELNNSQLAALLVSLKIKGESPEEVAGFVMAMRSNSVKINCDIENTIDLCGTGGDESGTFNISTASAFVVAGAGVNVAKHGNRSISSKSGSSDVLAEMGININLSPENSEKALEKIGITFLFAPQYHPAMKFAAQVRNELGMKTIFNNLGPLTNPAGTKKQLIGTFNNRSAKLMAEAAEYLDMQKICFVNSHDRFDEISLIGNTNVYEYKKETPLKVFEINASHFLYDRIDFENIKGDSAKENAKIIISLFTDKKKTDSYKVVSANAAMALYVAGYSKDLIECKNAAEESIDSGRTLQKLIEFKYFGELYA